MKIEANNNHIPYSKACSHEHICNDTFYNEFGLCAQNIVSLLDPIFTQLGGPLQSLNKKENHLLTSYHFCMSTPILKLRTTIFFLHTCYRIERIPYSI